ncbi:MAG: type 4a pilus biogenesis protein PilO [Deltaproteobacteria bacterium]|nr:type 4a pilus biogenesis protein PilO [Deltaproteobacteria bacterium]MBI2210016.1 type 4a pilus biogenesis protein PilO [Deltaproteobacteria bacterium]MBI3061491.1 type 4a pilus biogenesis protein PilO [Deltaproteobacteria bacterium]
MKGLWQRLSRREKGLVALTLVIFLLVLVRYLLVSPFLERREWVKSQLEIQPQLLERNLRYVGQKERIAASLEKFRGEIKTTESSLLSGDTSSVSASDLQQTVQALAAKEGTQVISTRVLNPETTGSFTKIPIQVEVSGQIDQVANLIKGIESGEKLLVVSELNIRSLFVPAPARAQAVAPPPTQNLRASVTIAGFARSQTAPPSKAEPAPSKAKSENGKAAEKGTGRR